MTYYSTVTSKGQMTLPVELRKLLHIQPGQKVAISINDHGEAVIEAVPSIEELRGRAQALLKKRGFTEEKLREMALNYKSGDGLTAALKEKYGKR